MATPKKNNPNKDLTEALGLGPRDIEVLVKAYSCMKEPPQIDYKKLAELCNFNSTDSARKQWHSTKNKMNGTAKPRSKASNQDGQTGTTTPDSDATPTPKRKRATKDGIDPDATPTKRTYVAGSFDDETFEG